MLLELFEAWVEEHVVETQAVYPLVGRRAVSIIPKADPM
jgi:hypothetical protein